MSDLKSLLPSITGNNMPVEPKSPLARFRLIKIQVTEIKVLPTTVPQKIAKNSRTKLVVIKCNTVFR